MANRALARMDRTFRELYSRTGRPSVPPEQLLRALLLQVLYSIRSERLLMEQLEYNLLFRWFVGLEMDHRVWDVTPNKRQLTAAGGGVRRPWLAAAGPGVGPPAAAGRC